MEYNFLVSPDDPPPIIGSENVPPITLKDFTPKMFIKDVGKAYQQLGGLTWLITQATAAPAEFMKLLQKMMPKQVDLDLLEGTTIKLIDQFGQSIELSGPVSGPGPGTATGVRQIVEPPHPTMRSGQPLDDKAVEHSSVAPPALEIATGGSPINVVETFK